jgi:hypothetical protein
MSYIHPAAVEHQRQRWMRPDAHRFAPPERVEHKSYAERMMEARQAAEEEARLAAEREELDANLLLLRRDLAEIKFTLALCRISYKYRDDQPRVPKGNPDGGQWTRDDAGKGPLDEGARDAPMGTVMSDAVPDSIRAGARYAQTQIVIHERALTGIEDVDRTTRALTERLAAVVDLMPEGAGRFYGLAVHAAFKASLLARPIPGVEWEVSLGGDYGEKGTRRPDLTYRSDDHVKAFYDIKTGDAKIEADWLADVRVFSKPNIPVIELSVKRGALLKSMSFDRGRNSDVYARFCLLRHAPDVHARMAALYQSGAVSSSAPQRCADCRYPRIFARSFERIHDRL